MTEKNMEENNNQQEQQPKETQGFLSTPLRGLLTVAIALFAVVGVVSAATTLREHYLPAEQEESSEGLEGNSTVSKQSVRPSPTATAKPTQRPVNTTRETATSQTDNQRQQPVERAPEPEPKEKEVFLSSYGFTISCPAEYVDVVKDIDADILKLKEKIEEGKEKYDELVSDCFDDCEERYEESKDTQCGGYDCSLHLDEEGYKKCLEREGDCLDRQYENYRDCVSGCSESYADRLDEDSYHYDMENYQIGLNKEEIERYCGDIW